MLRKILFLTVELMIAGVFPAACGNVVTLGPTATRAASASPVPPSATLVPSVTVSSSLSATPTRITQPTRTAGPTHTARPPTLTPPPTATLINGSTSKIAFASCDARFASCEIFVINVDPVLSSGTGDALQGTDGSQVIKLYDSQVIRL